MRHLAHLTRFSLLLFLLAGWSACDRKAENLPQHPVKSPDKGASPRPPETAPGTGTPEREDGAGNPSRNPENPMNTETTGNEKSNRKKILVAYFSHSGNTRVIANRIRDAVDGTLFEIVGVDPYPQDYDTVVAQAARELKASLRPKLKHRLADAGTYDVIFLGYPNWWGTFPMPVATFLSTYDFAGKTVVPFCTHEGSGLGRSASDVAKMCPKATVFEGLAIRGRNVNKAGDDVAAWLRKLGF